METKSAFTAIKQQEVVMNLKESFESWKYAIDNEDCYLWTDAEINDFFIWHNKEQKQPIVKPAKHSIDHLYKENEISVRMFNVFQSSKIYTLEDLANYEKTDIERLRNFGKKSVYLLENLMKEHGIEFKDPS